MKSIGEILMAPEGVSEIVMGNTALVRGMLEAGVRVAASYPGSPTPEIAEAIGAIPKENNPIYFEFSTNEKVATEVCFGASLNGHLATVFFKSVGLNVAADVFVQLSFMELTGGMVIVLGDDPGAYSSQNEQDNRHYARLSYIPVLEPSSPAEMYTMFKTAAKLSQERKMPVILRVTTHVCHAKEKVTFASMTHHPVDDTPQFSTANGPYLALPAHVASMKRRAIEKLSGIEQADENTILNRVVENHNSDRGVITMGLTYLSLEDVLENVTGKPDILKLGIVHPLPKKIITEFLRSHREVKILEELDDFVEQQVKALAYDLSIPVKIIGKVSIDDWLGEYTPDKVTKILMKTWPDLLTSVHRLSKVASPWSSRPAQLCPGCGHRSAFYAIQHALAPEDITVADIGCHGLGAQQPYNMGQVVTCMGHSSGTAAGLSLFNTSRKVVAFLGDSTFYHAGLPGIINAVYNQHNFTLIILDNGTTAMTGHQNTPGNGLNANGPTVKMPIRQVLEGLGIKNIQEVDAYAQGKLREAVTAAVAEPTFSVIIAKHPCMLKTMRELRSTGKTLPPEVTINKDCSLHHDCVEAFACPTFQRDADGTVWVSKDLCIGDGSCKQTCPAKAIVSGTNSGKEAK